MNKLNNTPSFKGYYDAKKIKNFEKLFALRSMTNKNLTPQDGVTMRKSITSYNAFLKGAETLNVSNIENEIYRKTGIPANFHQDKHLAAMVGLTINIFKKLNLPLPSAVEKYPLEYGTRALCDLKTGKIFFNDCIDWANTQEVMINERLENYVSSGHFMRTAIHEFMHNVHLINLKKNAQLMKERLSQSPSELIRKNFATIDYQSKMIAQGGTDIKNESVAEFISKNVSDYGAQKPVEMFADKTAQMIADSLNEKNLLPVYNPFYCSTSNEDEYLMNMIKNFWKGKFEAYI